MLLDSGLKLAETTIFRLDELGLSILEDGLYVGKDRLSDPVFVDQLTRFVRASLAGWKHAVSRPREAVQILVQKFPGLDREHQLRMASEVNMLVNSDQHSLGLLAVDTFAVNVQTLGYGSEGSPLSRGQLGEVWTHRIWRTLDDQEHSPLSDET